MNKKKKTKKKSMKKKKRFSTVLMNQHFLKYEVTKDNMDMKCDGGYVSLHCLKIRDLEA